MAVCCERGNELSCSLQRWNLLTSWAIRGSSVSTVTELRAGLPVFDSWQGQEFFHFTTAYRPALGLTQPPLQRAAGAHIPWLKRYTHEAHHSRSASAEVKNAWSYTSTTPHVFIAWCLVKHRDSFTFYTSCNKRWTERDGFMNCSIIK